VQTLRSEDKVALLRSCTTVTARGWAFAESHQALCHLLLTTRLRRRSAKVLFLELKALEAMSEEAIWDVRMGAKPDAVVTTFQSFEAFFDLARWRETRLACQAVEAWLVLQRRTVPTPAVVARHAGKKTEAELWTLWTRHAVGKVVEHAKVIARQGALVLNRCSPRADRSTITSYIPYLTILLRHIQSVFATAGQQGDLTLHLATVADLADATRELFARAAQEFDGAPPSVGSRAVDALRAALEAMAVFALERAGASLSFDPAQPGYVTQARHDALAPLLVRLTQAAHLKHLPALKAPLLAFCERIFEGVKIPAAAARLGFVEVVTAEQRRSFAHFKPAVHKTWSATALGLLTTLRAACGAAEADSALSGLAWARYKAEKFGGRAPKRSDKKFADYLQDCLQLPASVLAAEKAGLVEAAVALLKADEFDPVAEAFARLGWLVEALDGCGAGLVSRDKYLLKHGDVALPAVRELLQAATSDREPTLRIQAHLALLNRSLGSLAEAAASLAFVARRIRNEAGLYRPAIYQWLGERLAGLVSLSLVRARDGAEAEALRDIDSLCDSLERMLRDDVSKRDTVAKSAFRGLATTLLAQALTFDGARPLVEARRRWVACGVQLDWIVVRALDGERGSESFVWPVQACTLPRARTVPEAWLEAYRPFLAAHFRAGLARFDELRLGVYTRRLQREAGTGPRFEAAQAVELLVEALGAVERPAADALTAARAFPPAAGTGAESTLLRRAKALFGLAKVQWTEVPRLVRFFEAMVDGLEDGAVPASERVGHFRQTQALFDSVRAQYPQRSLWYEVPLLARACDRLFDAAIRLQLPDAAQGLYPVWCELRAGQGRTPLATALSLAQAQFLAVELAGLDAAVLDTRELTERRCAAARTLLAKAPSSAYLLKDDLVTFRDDLLTDYTRKTRGELRGPFDPAWATPLKGDEAQARAPIAVAANLWPNLNGQTMLAYTRDALEEAMTLARSPNMRSAAIAQFVQSPASSHFEIIELLQKLMAKPAPAAPAGAAGAAAPAEAPADDARELLLETVILCVFQTDAAWFVLAYLLSPDVIATSQRTTASILTNLHSWVPMDKVVSVLRILLEPQRRWAIQAFLHKAILRLLLDNPQAEARRLFAHEWAARAALQMHPDVRHEMVKLAVGALADADADKAAIAWTIAEEVARQPAEFGTTTAFMLFLPTWCPPDSFAGQRRLDGLVRLAVPNSEVPDSFGLLHGRWLAEAPIPYASPQVRDRMAALLRTLAAGPHPYLRTVATCMGFLLSPGAVGDEDEASLDALQALLLTLSIEWRSTGSFEFPRAGQAEKAPAPVLPAEEDYLFLVAPRVLASLGLQVLTKKLQGYTEHERQTARALDDVCERQAVAQRLRGLFGRLIEALAQVPPVQVEKRLRLTRVAEGLLSTATEWGFGKALFTRHFREALAFLRGDLDRLQPLLGE
jgi:hypothetical protein